MFTESHLRVIWKEVRAELGEYNKMNDKVRKKRDGEKKFSSTCQFLASKDYIDGWAKKKLGRSKNKKNESLRMYKTAGRGEISRR